MNDINNTMRYQPGGRVQLRVGSHPRGVVKGIVFPGLYDVEFDHADTLGRRRWLCEPVELEPALVCRATAFGFIVVADTIGGAV